jgi:nucleotidyltransferase substrate binding protein (TIGR01987 family)
LKITNPDITQKAGIIQFFEISFELAWKVMKDYSEEIGFTDVKSPRDAIKKSFETGIIDDGETWIKALADRNLSSHTYEEITANEIDNLIRTDYFKILNSFKIVMQAKL